MRVERVVNGNNGVPERGHEYIDEEQGGEGAQGHEGQHGRWARVRCPSDVEEAIGRMDGVV